MHCVVTAGPAFEPIDQVRRLTNFSTGHLGTELARHLAHRGHSVALLRSETATYHPEPSLDTSQIDVVSFSSSQDLWRKIEAMRDSAVDAFFHVAAVGDFTCGEVWQRNEDGTMRPLREGKISSQLANLFLKLNPAPKIIARLRETFPNAWLVGWKYEVEGNRESLDTAANRQIRLNRTDACVINGPAYGQGFGYVLKEHSLRHLVSKEELFDTLTSTLPRGMTV